MNRAILPPGDHEGEEKPSGAFGLDDLDLDEEDIEAKTETLEVFLPPKKEGGKSWKASCPIR